MIPNKSKEKKSTRPCNLFGSPRNFTESIETHATNRSHRNNVSTTMEPQVKIPKLKAHSIGKQLRLKHSKHVLFQVPTTFHLHTLQLLLRTKLFIKTQQHEPLANRRYETAATGTSQGKTAIYTHPTLTQLTCNPMPSQKTAKIE